MANPEYNPFQQLGEDAGVLGGAEGIRVYAGLGFFPPLAVLLYSCSYHNGQSAHAPLDTVSPTKHKLALAALLVLVLGVTFL